MLRSAVSMGGSLRGASLVRGITFISGSTGEDLGQSIEAQNAARQWLASYNSTTIPRKTCEVKFSRSSGPGGQKVNK
jgi:protein subunit release factor B